MKGSQVGIIGGGIAAAVIIAVLFVSMGTQNDAVPLPIENDVVIGNHVTIKNGVYLWDGIRVEDHVFIGPNVTFTNDKYPRSKAYPARFQTIQIRTGASIGAGSVVLGGVEIGQNAMVGAGSLVTESIPPNELWFGSPAKFIRKLDSKFD